jgi:RNA polymerase sigma-70 factor (ECF subfamily)
MIAEGAGLVRAALGRGPVGPYQVQAAIAALHDEAPSTEETDWPQIVELYDRLLAIWPSPVVALNRTVPLAMVAGPGPALDEVVKLEQDPRLSGYQYLPAIKADLLRRLGRPDLASAEYRAALALTTNDAERAFLSEQLASLPTD